MAFDILWRAITIPYYRQYVISLTQDLANRIFEVFKSKIIVINPLIQDIMKIKENPWPEIRLQNGSEIHFRSIAGEGVYIRGRSADRIILDEAAFIPASIESAIRPLLLDKGGEMVRISTPRGMNAFYDEFMRGKREEKNYKSFHFTSWDNPHINQKWLAEEKVRVGEESIEWQCEYAAQFLEDTTAVFKAAWIDAAQTNAVQWLDRGIDGHRYVMGVDVAQTIDYTVISVLEIDGVNTNLVAFDRFHHLGFTDMCARIEHFRERFLPEWSVVDSTGQIADPIGSMLNREFGYIESVNLHIRSKQDIIQMLSVALEHKRLKYRPDEKTRVITDELTWYQSEISDVLKTMRYSAPSGKHDDATISLALAIYAANKIIPREAFFHSEGDNFAENLEKRYPAKDPTDANTQNNEPDWAAMEDAEVQDAIVF